MPTHLQATWDEWQNYFCTVEHLQLEESFSDLGESFFEESCKRFPTLAVSISCDRKSTCTWKGWFQFAFLDSFFITGDWYIYISILRNKTTIKIEDALTIERDQWWTRERNWSRCLPDKVIHFWMDRANHDIWLVSNSAGTFSTCPNTTTILTDYALTLLLSLT